MTRYSSMCYAYFMLYNFILLSYVIQFSTINNLCWEFKTFFFNVVFTVTLFLLTYLTATGVTDHETCTNGDNSMYRPQNLRSYSWKASVM